MNYKVFFAFQMDIADKFGKGFIQSAIEIAIGKLKKELINVSLDYGFRGTPGTPILIEEMLNKNNDSDMVIADLTFTSSKEWWLDAEIIEENENTRLVKIPKLDRKPSPNPNVLIETGYAWAKKGAHRTLIVMNTAFGSPEELPVDLKGFRWGIQYSLHESNYLDRKGIRQELALEFYNAIKNSINSEADYQREKWRPIRLYKYWTPIDYKMQYHVTNKAKIIISELRANLENTSLPQRIVGPKNSGKSRLAYEIYNFIDETLPKHENLEKILYYDMEAGEYSKIEDKIQDLRFLNQRKILILDNCDYRTHKRVFDEYLHNSNISLLSIGTTDDGDGTIQYVDKDFANDIIKEYASKIIHPANISFIIEESNGNLRTAFALILAHLNNEEGLKDEYVERWKQILGTDLISKNVLTVLEEISLFNYIGFEGGFKKQAELIFQRSGINQWSDFESLIYELAEKGIIKITGDFFMLEAFAEELASNRLAKLTEENMEPYIQNIISVDLTKSFSDRIIDLKKLNGINQIISFFTKENGFLTKYEFVSSEPGGRLIMSFAELEPLIILQALEKLLKNKSEDDLKKLIDGRRSLVWVLERLVFKRETFKGAAKLLFKLAQGENEEYGNNATSQFLQLFQVYLPGTQATFKERIELIEELILDSNDHKLIEFALDRALMTHGFFRMTGAEMQGGVKLEDYQPSSNKEVFSYLEDVLRILLSINAYEIIENKLHMQVTGGNSTAILDAIEAILNKKKITNKNLRQQLEYLLNEELDLPNETTERVKRIISKYSNNSMRDKLEYTVALGAYSTYKNDNGDFINRSDERVKEIVQELSQIGTYNWLEDIDVLLQNEQRFSFNFGRYMSAFFTDNEAVLNKVIDSLKNILFEDQNISFFEGYLSNTAASFIRKSINAFIDETIIAIHSVRMNRYLIVTNEDLQKLIPVVESKPDHAYLLSYIKINHLADKEVINYIEWIMNISPYGITVAIDICVINFEKQEEISPELIELFNSLLIHKDFFQDKTYYSPITTHQYTLLLEKVSKFGLNNKVVEFITNKIMGLPNDFLLHNQSQIKYVLQILLNQSWEIAWPIIAEKIQGKGYFGWYNLKSILKRITSYKSENLLEWMDKYPNKAPQKIIEFIRLSNRVEDEEILSPLVLDMIERYHQNQLFLKSLENELHSYTWVGSLIPLLESRKKLVEQLAISPIEEIRKFAEHNINYFNAKIDKEKRDDENNSLNY